jgi:hypothetical protein
VEARIGRDLVEMAPTKHQSMTWAFRPFHGTHVPSKFSINCIGGWF